MKKIAHSLIVVFVALIAIPAVVAMQTLTTAFQLLATTVLIMGGTQHPLSLPTDSNDFVTAYMDQAINNYVDPDGTPVPANPAEYNRVAVIYPAEFFPVFGSTTFDDSVAIGQDNLSHCLGVSLGECNYNSGVGSTDPSETAPPFIVFGYSQSAVVASLVKNQIVENPDDYPGLNGTTFYLISNPMRPNGGILGRGPEGTTIPILGITFYGPTENSCDGVSCEGDPDDFVTPTVDVAQQYDLLGGDAPAVVWNGLAWANSAAAYYYLHGDVPSHSLDEAISRGTYGDTDYYLLTSDRLPILLPAQQLGVPDALLAVADAPLRVLIESAYYRGTSPGESVGFQLLPQEDALTLLANLAQSVPVGIDDGLEEAGIGRLLGTNDVNRPFGVGGETYDDAGNELGVESHGVWSAPVPDADADADEANSLRIESAQVNEPQTVTTSSTPGTEPDGKAGQNAEQLGNDLASEGTETPDATKPDPFAKLRESMKFDPAKPLAGLQPNGDGPLKRIINALTGQESKTTTSAEANDAGAPAA
ncbi:PE-PPE domain-containing protein [Mycolicibacterium stellerae]|uniref:PE-PPE domain-containing protein n=1 Tax=Mycolicibacterium stellerae TaxID=2358193 RepID=UPI000F0B69C8|nr:PE-PPE domain-containing protein [Mycolicibacterium stellerae]